MSLFITGPAGSGKTTQLLQRVTEAAAQEQVFLTAPSEASLNVLRARLDGAQIPVLDLASLALRIVTGAEIIDDVRAAQLFEEAAQPLLSLSWTEFMEAELDPEVPGLRAPERFLEAAFRLFCKLRDARISPEEFLESALRGATQFYAKPPNLAHADLLQYTKDQHRDSLVADAAELQRQYRREIDLAKILAKLYRTYLDHPVRAGCLTLRDAVAQAAGALEKDSARAAALRARYPKAFVDDAQDLTLGELQLLQGIYGEALEGVTLAGDSDSAICVFAGARPDRVFAVPGERIVLDEQHRSPGAIDTACRHLLGAAPARGEFPGSEPVLTLFRASTQRAEAQFIADRTIELLDAGVPHDEIAVLFHSVESVRPYRDALLDRNVRVQVAGDLNVFSEPEALDALAVLWSVHDPYRHEYLLRVLAGGALALADATIYALCGEPPDKQTLLFSENGAPSGETRSGRWDPKRDLRLAWNVLRGDRDADISAPARERLQRFRVLRAGWFEASRSLTVPQLIRLIWTEGLARIAEPGSARAAYQQQTLARVYERICAFAAQHPQAALGDFLEYAQVRMDSAFSSRESSEVAGAVRMLSIEAARGRAFDHVIVANARAGTFPRWYVPDAFLYSPSLGMIAKENVGEARAARTAKFSYYMYRTKAREAYNREARRAFVYALRRARKSAVVTACERATRGQTAPEFLSELQAARLPATVDISDRWRPARTVYGT